MWKHSSILKSEWVLEDRIHKEPFLYQSLEFLEDASKIMKIN
jgi:hypothetical protein